MFQIDVMVACLASKLALLDSAPKDLAFSRVDLVYSDEFHLICKV